MGITRLTLSDTDRFPKMETFPLYETLKQRTPTSKPQEVSAILSSMGPNHGKIVYALMLHYYYKTNGTVPSSPPYNGNMLSDTRGMAFNPRDIPSELFRIMTAYAEMVATSS